MDAEEKSAPDGSKGGGQKAMTKRRQGLLLALTFLKFGAITFGGGYAIVALLEDELVHRRGWITSQELLDIITIGESTPGAIAVNTATFVGYRVAGVWGGIGATVALVFPAWLTIVVVSTCYLAFRENVWVAAALAGIRVAALVLIAKAFVRMGKSLPRTWVTLGLMAGAFVLVAVAQVSAVAIVAGGLAFGVLWYGVRPRLRGAKERER